MREAIVPFAAAAVYIFCVHRWVSDEFASTRRLTQSAATAVAIGFLLLTTLILLASLGGVLGVGLPRAPSIAIGAVLAVMGLLTIAASVRALGSRERLLGMGDFAVVSHGPYRYSRHPFYIGCVLFLLGFALAGRSALAFGLIFLTTLALARISRGEERWLTDELGSDYERYRRQGRGLIGRARSAAGTQP